MWALRRRSLRSHLHLPSSCVGCERPFHHRNCTCLSIKYIWAHWIAVCSALVHEMWSASAHAAHYLQVHVDLVAHVESYGLSCQSLANFCKNKQSNFIEICKNWNKTGMYFKTNKITKNNGASSNQTNVKRGSAAPALETIPPTWLLSSYLQANQNNINKRGNKYKYSTNKFYWIKE